MKFVPTPIEGVFIVEPEPVADQRGSFENVWTLKELRARKLACQWGQCAVSRNTRKGTLRGLHYQIAPHGQVKLVRCIRGAIFDVALDLRPRSATRGRWFGVRLTPAEGRALYIPKGMAHGILTLEDETQVMYHMSHRWHPQSEKGVRWDDPTFAIEWPTAVTCIAPRDASFPNFSWRNSPARVRGSRA